VIREDAKDLGEMCINFARKLCLTGENVSIMFLWIRPSCWPGQTKWKPHSMRRFLRMSLPFLAMWTVASWSIIKIADASSLLT
jgi:hypothetical protein